MRSLQYVCLLIVIVVGYSRIGFGQSPSSATKPNIVFIYTDDQRYDALSVVQQEQGSAARFPWFKTPNLDRLAREGVRFRNAFVINSLCSPSRATLLNGKYNHLNGIVNNHTSLTDTTVTYATLLHQAGYKTAFIGKWHMGEETGKRPGFDYSFSFIGQGIYQDCPIEENGKTVQTNGWVDDVTTDKTIEFIRANQTKTFAVVLGFKSAHLPFQPPARHTNTYADATLTKPVSEGIDAPYKDKVDNGKTLQTLVKGASWTETNDLRIRNYFRTLKAVDDNVGKVLNVLDSLKLAENTVVIFSSDNGFFFGEHNLFDKRAAYEESMRIPLLVRYPARFPKGKLIDKMVLNLDMAPSLVDLAGIPAPASFQGKSWVPLIEEKAKNWRTSFLYEYFFETGFNTPTIKAIRTETSKLILYPGQDDWSELYDLSKDPNEQKNLYNAAEGTKLKTQLTGELIRQEKAVGYTNPSYADKRPVNESGQYIPPKPAVYP